MLELPPLSLYVHIPWCVQKCPYCDFNSHAMKSSSVPEEAYVDALMMDLRADLHWVQGREVQSVFIGGGTPSVFTGAAMRRIMAGVRDELTLSPHSEVTMEANPGTFEIERFAEYRAAGINRLSVGVQSFDDAQLKKLGRIHSADEVHTALSALPEAGFDNFNVDLMFGLPGQTEAEALSDLRQALVYSPPHLSWYQLTIEPNTAFAHHPPITPEDDALAEMQAAGIALLDAQGLARYEVSAYSRSNKQSVHNLNYWQFGDYLGIGAGAHSKWTERSTGVVTRVSKKRHPTAYLQGSEQSFISQQSPIAQSDLPLEFMMNAMRLREGVPSRLFEQRTGLDLQTLETAWRQCQALGLMDTGNAHLRPTQAGFGFLNELLMHFMAAEDDATD